MIELRDYQDESCASVRQSFIDKYRAPLLVIPTGGGKTIIFSWVCQSVILKGKKVLILAHRGELLKQASRALDQFDVPHGMISPEFTPDVFAPSQVASVQTIVRRMFKMSFYPDLIIIDEAHHAISPTYVKVLEHFPLARVLGVTATPIRSDGRGLGVNAGGIFDKLIIGPSIQLLIDRGFLVKPLIYAPLERIDMSKVKKSMGDFDKAEVATLIDKSKITGDVVSHYKKICYGVRAVCFCINLVHSGHVVEEFIAQGVSAESIDGTMDATERAAILDRFEKGITLILVSVDLVGEGFDLPAIGCAILLRPTDSLGLFLQQVGRALRLSEGKSVAYILDHVGNVIRHGLPEEEREWSLEGEIKTKKGKKEKEKKVKISQCPSCYCIHAPAPTCPQCDHLYEKEAREIEQEAGELQLMSEGDKNLIRKSKSREIASARTFDELKALEVKNGYKDGWAKHVFNSRTKKEINI